MSHLFLYRDHPLILTFFFIFFIALPVQSKNTTNPNCVLQTCGDVNISYPFWKMDDDQSNTQFCGYEGFGIKCFNEGRHPNISSIKLDDDFYYVSEINYTLGTIYLADFDVSPVAEVQEPCPKVDHNISLGSLPFDYSTNSVNISFHFDCVNGCPHFAQEIPCMSNIETKSCVHVMNTNMDEFLIWEEFKCDKVVVTAGYKENIDRVMTNLNTGFKNVLEQGFALQWKKMDKCDKCENSGGKCGNHSTTGFRCFCPDGTINNRVDCKPGSVIDWKVKLGIGFGSAVFGVIIMCFGFCFWWRRHNKRRYYSSSYMSRKTSSHTSSMVDPEKNGTYHGVPIFKYRELEKATNYFDEKNELGDGGFGTVYQGKLKDGRVVAVKRLYENNYKRVEQFMNEVALLAHLRHRNLVTLYGCTTHHSRELLLVYEYIPNGTVADHLHGEKAKPGSLTWTTRMSIALETASALVYLHASDVVHRDVKTNNILLDSCFTVKVADFGLSRLFPSNVTHVSTAPQGTPGYVDPEYHECYQLTNKSDVYSFGVVLVELISSKPAVDITRHRHEINLSSMALSKIQNNAIHELVDPHLGYESEYEVRKMINAVAELAFQCLQNERDCRPSMDEVLECLLGIQNGMYNKNKNDALDGGCDDEVLLKNYSQNMSPDSVAVAWSTSTLSTSSG